MDFKKIAAESVLDYSSKDKTAQLAHSNAISGFEKILSCLHAKGVLGNNSKLIALPDYTYTRNNNRWRSGFSNGYILYLDSEVPFIPIGFRPNCCGTIMSKIGNFNESEIHKFSESYKKEIKRIPDLNSDDVNRMNHFLGIYKNSDGIYYALLHCSFNFVKSGYGGLRGLSIDECKTWNGKMKPHLYEGEELQFLIENDATEYFDNYTLLEERSNNMREVIMKTIFPDSKTIFNKVHQGFFDIKTILLGAYVSNKSFSCPIMLKERKPLPIVEVNAPIKIGEVDLFCAPHGCGYQIKGEEDENRLISTYNGDFYIKDENSISVKKPFNLDFDYRENAHTLWCDEYNKGIIKNEYEEVANFKI